jgi:hypothetical protein
VLTLRLALRVGIVVRSLNPKSLERRATCEDASADRAVEDGPAYLTASSTALGCFAATRRRTLAGP